MQGLLVNGSVGRVEEFMRVTDAQLRGIAIGVVYREGQTSSQPRSTGPPVPQHILKSNKLWPYVRFENGLSLLCIPVQFEVINAQGRIEASREQVRRLSLDAMQQWLILAVGTFDPGVGNKHTQVPRADIEEVESRPGAHLRKGSR